MAAAVPDHPGGDGRRISGGNSIPRGAEGGREVALRAIRDRVDLVEFIGAYVSLKRSGQNAIGRCPFHADKRPSFSVSAAKQLYHCFGCGAGGDVFAFVMQHESLTFPESVQWLARKVGVPLPGRDATEADGRRRLLYEINASAAAYFRRCLDTRAGDAARRYLRSRHLTPDTIEAFGLGFAPASWDGLLTAMSAKGWNGAQLREAGLAGARKQGGWYDLFRHRVMCPIRDTHGQVVAFGGRVLDDGQPKYLNSPETMIFAKGRQLFALDRARRSIADGGTLIVVEGYFDVIAAHQAGFINVVATLGTALTPAHLETIRRFVTRVCLVFDADAAGVRAALRGVDLFAGLDMRVDVATLPAGKDPDVLIHEEGADAFRDVVEDAVSLVEFALGQSVPRGSYRAHEAKKAAVSRALPVIAKLPNAVDRAHYLGWLADRVGVSESVLREDLTRIRVAGPPTRGSGAPAPSRPAPAARRSWPYAEEKVAAAVVHGRLAPGVLATLDDEAMTDGTLRSVVAYVAQEVRTGDGDAAIAARDRALSEGRQDVADALAQLATHVFDGDDPDQAIYDCVIALRVGRYDRLIGALTRAIHQCETEGDSERSHRLQVEQGRLVKERSEVRTLFGSRMGPMHTVGG